MESLAALRQKFARWRGQPKRKRKIPEELWVAAAEAAGEWGVCRVARELRLNYTVLRDRVRNQEAETEETDSHFVELDATAMFARAPVIELTAPDGATLRVEIPGGHAVDVVRLAQAFWERGA